ncbi:MAG: transposase [Oligoflexus sp.]|nr:transposase [Oligoflexus sp.]
MPPYVIEELGRALRKQLLGQARYLRADSGYCNNQVFDACDKFWFKFVIALRENFYGGLFKKRLEWRKAKSDVLLAEGVELAENHYSSKQNGRLYRVVLMRKPILGPRPLFEDAKWEYHAFITSLLSHEMSHDDLILFYRGRGNAENYIKELKYGFDLKHFPCQKLDVNRVYGLVAAFAHNLTRFVSCRMFPGKTAFVKKLRFRLINLAAQVVRQARQIHIVFNTRYKEEITRCIMNINLSPSSG